MEEPTSKTIEITGSPETKQHMINSSDHSLRQTSQILDHHNLTHIIFTGKAKFRISGHVDRCNCDIWGSEPPREQLERERDSPELNVRCADT